MQSNDALSVQQVRDIINKVDVIDKNKISSIPAFQPKAGEVYLYQSNDNSSVASDWRCDGYRWKNSGCRKLPKNKPYLRKMYNKIHTENNPTGSDRFVRHVYSLIDKPQVALIHYMGDESEFVPFPHGNNKNGDKNYTRTCPSVLQGMRDQVENDRPGNVYKKMVCNKTPGEYQGILNPRNIKQVQNAKAKVDSERRLSNDDVYNLLELAYHLPETVWKIDLYPDLACVVGIEDLLQELNNALASKNQTVLQYDTTFNLGDYYVSPLIFRHNIYDQNPSIPVAFLIHDRKYQDVHEMFFRTLKDKIPNLKRKDFVAVVDREIGISRAFQNIFPHSKIVHCWNHIKRDIRTWLRDHGASSAEIGVYINDVVKIMQTDSIEDMDLRFTALSSKWSQSMVSYFDENLRSSIENHAAKFILEPLGLYDPFSGVTNNASESINTVIKSLTAWNERPVDVIVLTFYQLQNYFLAEIRRGLAGIGSYTLTANYRSIQCPPEDIVLPNDVCDPAEIVNNIKEQKLTWQTNPVKPSTCNDYIDPKSIDNENNTNLVNNATTLADKQPDERPASARNLSQAALASRVIEENRICHVSKMGVFVVEGSKGDKYAVTLFPKESCGCPSTGECYHILAAKMSVGMPGRNQNKVINLTQLKRNSRKRVDKKGGRKQPRKNDLDMSTILPAPDSVLCQNSVIENPEFENSNDPSLWLPTHASTPKKPSGILMKTEVTPGKKGVGKPCKVTFKDLDNSNASEYDPHSNKNSASDDEIQNPKSFNQTIVKDNDINLVGNPKVTFEHSDDINVNDNVSRPSASIPIKSPISDIANRPKQLLRLSRGKKRKSDANVCVSSASNSESKIKLRKTDSSAPATVDKLITSDGKCVSANKVLGTCVLLRDEINVDVKVVKKNENVSEKKSVCDVRKSDERCERRAVRYWQNKLHLTFQDKFNIINGSWLSDSHMRAVNEIARSQFPQINGFQDTVRIAMQNKSGKWEIPTEHLLPVTPPSVQIHYNGNSHWVTSFQFKDDDRVFLVDTLFAGQDPTMSLKIQLAQIYGKGRDKLEIIAPFVKSQVGGNDCGAFAIANLVEFCMGNFWRDKDSLSSRGDLCQDTLRSHLVTCFEKQKFSEFMARSSYGRKAYKSYSIDTNCSCGLPNEYDDNMVLCNGCGRWFHHVCAGVGDSSLPDVWLCFECEQVGDDVIGRSPRYV